MSSAVPIGYGSISNLCFVARSSITTVVFMVIATRIGIFMSALALSEEERPALTDAAGL
jgi:hypothetical protein